MNHTELINHIIKTKGYKTYLEIGVDDGVNFTSIKLPIKNKECCDPSDEKFTDITYHMTSDEMFARMPLDKKYDMIFIDGMHLEEYVDRDIINSLKHLNPNGIICLHDVIPLNYDAAKEYYDHQSAWNGTVWKSIPKLQDNNIEYYTVFNDDSGLCIVKYHDNPYSLSYPTYRSTLSYPYLFNDAYQYYEFDHITNSGRFVMRIITEDQLPIIL